MSSTVPLTGPGFQIPPNCKLIVIRAPRDTDPSVFNGLQLSDLQEDDAQVTKQIAIAYYQDDTVGFARTIPAKSFAYVDRVNKESKPSPKVVRLARPPMIPPTGLKVSPLPFDATAKPTRSSSKSGKEKSKKRKLDDAASEPSKKKKSKI